MELLNSVEIGGVEIDVSITIDEFLRLKKICEPKHSLDLKSPLTQELIDEALRRLPPHVALRLEAAKSSPTKEWPTLVFRRKDGLGNITPGGVAQAVGHAYWRLEGAIKEVAKEKASSSPVPVRLGKDGTIQCPWCGKFLALKSRGRSNAA